MIFIVNYCYAESLLAMFGEVPKMAEGTPLERVQVVNSGARVQIPPSPLVKSLRDFTNRIDHGTRQNLDK